MAVKSLRLGWVASTSRLRYFHLQSYIERNTDVDRLPKLGLCKMCKTRQTQKGFAYSTISFRT